MGMASPFARMVPWPQALQRLTAIWYWLGGVLGATTQSQSRQHEQDRIVVECTRGWIHSRLCPSLLLLWAAHYHAFFRASERRTGARTAGVTAFFAFSESIGRSGRLTTRKRERRV